MNTPSFWKGRGILSTALLPLSFLYALLARQRMKHFTPERLPVPVICVGNLTAGGAGKTPVVIALLEILRARSVHAQCISRGYGGSITAATRVDPARHTAAEVGDEPLLIARHAPCWIAKRRRDAAIAAIMDGAELIVMDDGLQNPTLAKDLSLLVMDGGFGFGNGRLLPAGPLRESLATGMAKAHAAILIGEDTTGVRTLLPPALPVLEARMVPARRLTGKRVIAFAGIGRPEKFFATVAEAGAELVATVSFADHHPYRAEDVAKLERLAAHHQATLITTEKDAVRLPEAFRSRVEVLGVHLRFTNDAAVDALLAKSCALT